MTEAQKERFRRNIISAGFSEDAQQCLLDARVCVIGAGGLGSAVLNYIVAAGVGTVAIVENDTVSVSNLQRQVLYTTADTGRPKAETAARRLSQLNPGCDITISGERLTAANGEKLLAGFDVIADCTDNFAARLVIDDFCSANGIPMVYGTAQDFGGQVSVFNYKTAGSYRDFFAGAGEQRSEVGVISPVAGIIGSVQALEIIKIVTGVGSTLDGRLLVLDGLTMKFSEFSADGR